MGEPVTGARSDRVEGWRSEALGAAQRAFSTTAALAAKGRSKPHTPPKGSAPSKGKVDELALRSGLEPAPTVATHTEGLPPEEDGELTWRDFDPEGGMPLPDGERSQAEINAVFGGEQVDAENGNYILSVMHWRRMSGALIDTGLDFPNRSGVGREQALRGLQYVRTLVPGFDEQEAGQRWAEEESVRLQDEIRERSIKLGIYKRDPADEIEEEEEESQQGSEYGRDRSRESELVKHRLQREAQWEQEQAALQARKADEERAALHTQRGPLELAAGVQPSVALTTTGPNGIAIGAAPQSGWLAPVERKPWVKYYEEQAQTIQSNLLPNLSIPGRLLPSLIFLFLILAAAVALPPFYTPPPKSARLYPDTPPAVATLTALTAILTTAFIASRLPPVWKTLNKYFTLVPAYPFAFSLFGATFRHDTLAHLAPNLLTLWLFGLPLHEDVGRATFLAIFFASASVGAFASLTSAVLRKHWMTYMFGSSGGVLGVAAATCVLRPNGTLAVMGYEVPVAAWVFLAVFGAAEAVAVVRGMKSGVDHVGHLGGIVAGISAGAWVRREAARRSASTSASIIVDGESSAVAREGGV